MKILKITLLSILGLFLLLLVVSFFLPSTVRVERSIDIKAKPDKIFKLFNNLKSWKQWSPWYQLDTTTQYTYSNIESGEGAFFNWKSKHQNVGEGTLKIVQSYPDTLLLTEMQFGQMGLAKATFHFLPTTEGTKLTWGMEVDSKNDPAYMRPLSKYFYLLMDQMVGPDYEKGLKNIQTITEADKTILVGEFEAEIRDFKGMQFIGIRNKLPLAEIGPKLNEYYSVLQSDLKKNNKAMKGYPFTINYAANGDMYDMQAALETDTPLVVSKQVGIGQIKPGKWLVVKYYGSYKNIGALYQKGFEFLAQNNLKPSAAPMEFYLVDPKVEPDSAKWLTELAFPFIE